MPGRSGRARQPWKDSDRLLEIAEVFRLILRSARIEIILLLADGPVRFVEVSKLLGLSRTGTSIHLAHLRAGGVVESEREGHSVHYRLTEIGERIVRLVEALPAVSRR